jgi:exonuclease VII small subunit
MIQTEFVRKDVALVNTDMNSYRSAVARREQDKYIKSLETRIIKLEDAMRTLETTVKEMTK